VEIVKKKAQGSNQQKISGVREKVLDELNLMNLLVYLCMNYTIEITKITLKNSHFFS
jgi:hypothetical protein